MTIFVLHFYHHSIQPTLAQKHDLLQGVLAIVCVFTLMQLKPETIYNFIKEQSVIKLYVIFNSMEVAILNQKKKEQSEVNDKCMIKKMVFFG
jgi:hypothetical protein